MHCRNGTFLFYSLVAAMRLHGLPVATRCKQKICEVGLTVPTVLVCEALVTYRNSTDWFIGEERMRHENIYRYFLIKLYVEQPVQLKIHLWSLLNTRHLVTVWPSSRAEGCMHVVSTLSAVVYSCTRNVKNLSVVVWATCGGKFLNSWVLFLMHLYLSGLRLPNYHDIFIFK